MAALLKTRDPIVVDHRTQTAIRGHRYKPEIMCCMHTDTWKSTDPFKHSTGRLASARALRGTVGS